MKNPFYLKPLPLTAPFCNREREIKDLMTHARNCTNVVISSPRRYGKTSLVIRVQEMLRRKDFVPLYIDFFGVSSIEDVASKFAAAIYSVIYNKKAGFKKAVRFFSSLRPVIKPDPETGMSITIEISRSKTGMELLEETMEGFGNFLKSSKVLCNVALDEFQEITELKECRAIEGIIRAHIQLQQNVSYFFIGSRRRILSDIFNDRKRPFYKSAINYSLPGLPSDATVRFLLEMFKKSGRSCPENIAREICETAEGCPYYIQKISYYLFDISEGKLSEKNFRQAVTQMLNEETPLFEMMLQDLRPRQLSFLFSLAKEPTDTPFNAGYLSRHHLGSLGGVQGAIKKLVSLDYIEKGPSGWKVVDPIFALWLRKREAME